MTTSDYVGVIKNIYSAFSAGDMAALERYIEDDFKASFNAYGRPELYCQALSYSAWAGITSREILLAVLKRDMAEWTAEERMSALTFFRSEPGEGDPKVICVFNIDYVVRTTGKKVHQKKVHLWTMSSVTSRAKSLEHFDDTAQVVDAFTL